MSEREVGPARAKTTWLFLAGAALVSLAFYREFVFSPGSLLFGTDMLGEGFPLRRLLVDEVRAGRGIPQWNPYAYGGMPYVATLPGPVFYPTTLLYFALPLYRAIGWTFVLHTFLAGAFGYFLGRSFRLRPAAAAVCGASFMLTGYVTSHLYGGHDGRIFAMVLIPLALGCLERGLTSGEVRWFAALAFAVALQIFTPHTQLMYFSSLALALYLVFHLAVRVPRGAAGSGEEGQRAGEGGGGAWAYLRPVALFAGAFALAAAIGAVQLLPTFALLDQVVRAAPETGYEFASSWALPPQELSALFLPDLIGSLETYWGRNPFKLHTEYLGAVPVALATLAVAASTGRGMAPERRRLVWFLAGASVLGVAFALGAATPVHRIAYAIVPMMDSFRAPAMMIGPVACIVALLAGIGWDRALGVRESASEGEGRLAASPILPLVLLSAPFLVLGLFAALSPRGTLDLALHSWFPAGWARTPAPELEGALRLAGLTLLLGWTVAIGGAEAVARRRVGELAVLVVIGFALADLWRVDARYLTTAEAEPILGADEVVARLQAEVAPGQRVWAAQGYRPNDLMYHGVASASGSQKFLLDAYARLVGGIRPDEGLAAYAVPLWALLDVRYVTATSEVETPLLQPLVEGPGGRRAYSVTDTLPHAYFPARVEVVSQPVDAWARTLAIEEPDSVAVVEATGEAGEGGAPDPAAGAGSARVVRYEPDEVVLEVRAERAGLLTVSEIHHPFWKAYVDGAEVRVWRTNTAFRGVEIPAGEHELRFRYSSRPFELGRWISLVSAAGALGLLAWPSLHRRRRAD